jgi:hypothetical protein
MRQWEMNKIFLLSETWIKPSNMTKEALMLCVLADLLQPWWKIRIAPTQRRLQSYGVNDLQPNINTIFPVMCMKNEALLMLSTLKLNFCYFWLLHLTCTKTAKLIMICYFQNIRKNKKGGRRKKDNLKFGTSVTYWAATICHEYAEWIIFSIFIIVLHTNIWQC